MCGVFPHNPYTLGISNSNKASNLPTLRSNCQHSDQIDRVRVQITGQALDWGLLVTDSIAIVDDHPLIRKGLSAAISERPGWDVVWTASGLMDSLALARTCPPDIAVVDLSLGDEDGLELIQALRQRCPKTRFVVSTMRDEALYAGRCLKAGAAAFVSKSESIESLIDAIDTVSNGGMYFSSKATAKLLSQATEPQDSNGVDSLSDRELQVFELIGRGYSTKRVAEALHVSAKTIETFRERIKKKLELKSASELSHYATSWFVLQSKT